ncbi:hypothetical protein, partial [Klenkia sp. PcliD-1-E]|uniref:hypothetical protein n=1 Tax=Klenkia sp. PcliD-1-E TaxID=2954492 RepID=UPI0020984EF4
MPESLQYPVIRPGSAARLRVAGDGRRDAAPPLSALTPAQRVELAQRAVAAHRPAGRYPVRQAFPVARL